MEGAMQQMSPAKMPKFPWVTGYFARQAGDLGEKPKNKKNCISNSTNLARQGSCTTNLEKWMLSSCPIHPLIIAKG